MGLTIIFPMGAIGGIVYFTKESVCMGLKVFTIGLGIAIGLMLAIGLTTKLSMGLILGIAEIAILGIGLKVFTIGLGIGIGLIGAIGLGIVSGLMLAIGIAIGLMFAIGFTNVLFMGLIFSIAGVTSLGIVSGLRLAIGLTMVLFIGVIFGIAELLKDCVCRVFRAGLTIGFIVTKGFICKLTLGILVYFKLVKAISKGISILTGLKVLFKFGMRVTDKGIL
ncbi:MAG: hypothetical protein PHT53_03470 [Candidatus Omnitrophica bacterium]|nr:hypothetical protein [Candidatus Omnitrophota bacterium]